MAASIETKESSRLQDYFNANTKHVILKWHHYFAIYEKTLSALRASATPEKKVVMLEIGVFHGGSLQMWVDYFGAGKCEIYGVDIDSKCLVMNGTQPEIKVIIGDQADPVFLEKLKTQIPAPDLILDDGGHMMKQQITSFESLFSFLKPGGIYMCEDTHTSYWSEYGGSLRSPASFIEHAKHAIDLLNAHHVRNGELAATQLTLHCSGIHFYDSIVVFDKATKPIPTPRACMTGTIRL